VTVNIDLWLWPLDHDAAQDQRFSALLSEDETVRAARFVKPQDARRYRAGRGRLRQVLGCYTGQDADSIAFSYNSQGKPLVAGGPRFNLSHSGGLAALAVTPSTEIGVDIEAFRPIENDVARRFFSTSEYRDISALSDTDWAQGFFRCWTRKEAVIKACGAGLSMPLDCFDVTLAPDDTARLMRLEHPGTTAADWRLIHLEIGPKIIGAIAIKAQGRPVRLNMRQGKLRRPAILD